MRHHLLIFALVILAFSDVVCAQNSRQVVDLGKNATALVDLGDKKSASAVCVDAKGIFITNQHVVKDIAKGGMVKLILSDDERTEVDAVVIRQDAGSDLAILQATALKGRKLAAIAFGDDRELFETITLTAFGFPFGKALAVKDQKYPEVSVNVGRVTALRKKGGNLESIQLDAQVNPGNSGGPVLDENGKLVGIIQSGVFATGVNFAIPVAKVHAILERPEIILHLPTLDPDKLHLEADFAVEVVPLMKPLADVVVEFELTAGDRPPQKVVAVAEKGTNRYHARTVPIPGVTDNSPKFVAGTANFNAGSLTAQFADLELDVAGMKLKLSDLRTIEFGENPAVTKIDGTRVNGQLKGLERVSTDLGGYAIELNLSRAKRLDLKPTVVAAPDIQYTATIRSKGAEIGRSTGRIAVKGSAPGVLAAAGKTKFVPYQGKKQVLELPDTASDAILAGGGRYILILLKKSRKVAVYDVNQAKITRFISLSSDNVMLAASLDKLIIVAPGDNVLERWSLETFERETTRTLPVDGVVKAISLGYASQGPLLIHSAASTDALARAGYVLVDLEKFEPLKVNQFHAHNSSFRDAVHLRASATGDVFGLWATSHSPQGLEVLTLLSETVATKYEHTSVGHVTPNYDGSALMTGFGGVLLPDLVKKGNRAARNMPCVPSTHARFYVSVPTEPGAQINLGGKPFEGMKPKVYSIGLENALIDLPDLELGQSGTNYSWGSDDFTVDKRVVFIPQANQLVSIPFGNDRLIVQPFDLKGALEKTELDYFYVSSVPPRVAIKGQAFQYQVEVVSRRGSVTYELSSGPEGMAVNSAGLLTWSVPGDAPATANIIITVKNSDGQSVYESFKLNMK